MEGPQRRDIEGLLANGFFKTKTAAGRERSPGPPSSLNLPSFLQTTEYTPSRERSRSRGPRRPPPPKPTVEDEAISLARESSASVLPSYDPPLRGKIDQNPIILEAEVTTAEAARLQDIPVPKDKDDTAEKRFVFLPNNDTQDQKDEIERKKREIRNRHKPEKAERDRRVPQEARRDKTRETRSKRQEPVQQQERKEIRPEPRKVDNREPVRPEPRRQASRDPVRPEGTRRETKETGRPPIERHRSRQDLPTLETKVPRDIPPQFRRSASAFASTPKETVATPQTTTRAPEYFLSPETIRPSKNDSSQDAPRQQVHDLLWGKSTTVPNKRDSGHSYTGSRPGTPNSEKEKRHSGNFDNLGRNFNEKLTRPQQLSEDFRGNLERQNSGDRLSGRSSRSSTNGRQYYSSSEDDIAPDSDGDKHRRRHQRHHLAHEESHRRSPSRSNRSSLDVKSRSRISSPLPSPKVSPSQLPRADEFERAQTFPQQSRRNSSRPVSPHSADKETPRADRLNPFDIPPFPKSRQSGSATTPKPPQATHTSLPLPIPIPPRDIYSSGDRSPSAPQFEDSRPAGPRPQPASWQPPSFQPPNSHLDKPVGSFRRYSEDIERGSIAPLPTCPRKSFISGRNDWLTLPNCPSFDICPSCFTSAIAPTEFRHMFVPAPRRLPETEVLCDFGSSPWYRIAWLLTLKERRRDLKLFYGLANIAANYQPCSGKYEAVRQWHSIIDPKTRAPIPGFDVCYSCVKSVEILLPAIRGIFVRTDSHGSSGIPRICDLRFESKRFVQYFDALETAADRADYDDAPPDTRNLATLVRRFAQFEECQQDTELLDKRWHIITQLPEFTVCGECFEDVVWPELDEGKAIPMMFNKNMQRIPKASCQLYSSKMRGIFRLAVDSGDYKMLAAKARERKSVEGVYKASLKGWGPNGAGLLGGRNTGAERELQRVEEEWRRWE